MNTNDARTPASGATPLPRSVPRSTEGLIRENGGADRTAARSHPLAWQKAAATMVAAAFLSVAVGCASDDDQNAGSVTELTSASSQDTEASGAGAGIDASGTDASGIDASGIDASSSATGISEEDLATVTDNELVVQAVKDYEVYVAAQIATLQSDTTRFTDAVRSGEVERAKALYPVSRRSWERIEPIAGLIPEIDGALDAREDDFDGPDDPAFQGWHRLEYLIWETGDLSGAGPVADQLDADVQVLADEAKALTLSAGVLTVGAQELIEEVAAPDGKLSGEEERYSETDLYSFQANVEGSQALVEMLAPALADADPELLADIDALFGDLNAQLSALGSFESGYPPYSDVTAKQRSEFAATLGELSEKLSLINGTLGLA